jgi:hypothetical protein
MRVWELVQDGVPRKLWHPIVGNVNWSETCPGCGCILTFAEGPEKGESLVVDSCVLHDDKWEITGPLG